jgi:hypothetical protein
MTTRPPTAVPSGTRAAAPPAFHVMAKPRGAICDLECAYCFYLSKQRLYPGSAFRMSDEILERYVRQLIEAHRAHEVTFTWQGGEPTLMGLCWVPRPHLSTLFRRKTKPKRAAPSAMPCEGRQRRQRPGRPIRLSPLGQSGAETDLEARVMSKSVDVVPKRGTQAAILPGLACHRGIGSPRATPQATRASQRRQECQEWRTWRHPSLVPGTAWPQ